jgi:hypothetical protein
MRLSPLLDPPGHRNRRKKMSMWNYLSLVSYAHEAGYLPSDLALTLRSTFSRSVAESTSIVTPFISLR